MSNQTKTNTSIKWITLVVLTLQNAGLAMLMRYSRVSTSPEERYIASTAVVLAEIIKLVVSVFVCYSLECNSNLDTMYHVFHKEATEGLPDALKLLVPSGLYVLQNNLQYIASSNLPAAVLQVLQQMKIITTAVLSEMILGKSHSLAQRLSVFALAGGVALVQQSTVKGPVDLGAGGQDAYLGVLCVVIACVTSGFAGVYFELVLKSSTTSLWVRNVEMALIGIVVSLPSTLYYDWTVIRERGFFHGYSSLVWGVILLAAGGGLVVALVVKYADNVLKGFATSVSIVISVLFSALYLQETELSMQFVGGTTLVMLAGYVYGTMPTTTPSKIISVPSAGDLAKATV
jgi:solute carrier family 35 (UDP-sugar transporter), member A1/2/3